MALDVEDAIGRPIGMGQPKRRFFGARQIILTLLVLILGGGGGVAAYFLADTDPKDLIAMLDVTDPTGPKLTWLLNDNAQQNAGAAPPAGATPAPPPPVAGARPPTVTEGPLVAPPGGVAKIPESPKVVEPGKPAEAAKGAEEKPAVSKLIDPKMFANLVMPPSAQNARQAPPPTPRSVEMAPSFSDLMPRPIAAALPNAPEKSLLGSSSQGPVPVVAADGRQPWKAYARPFNGSDAQPKVAIVVTDLGLNTEATDTAITRLPPDVTLAFSPYALDAAKWIKKARDNGHETLAVLPVVADGASVKDPGPLAVAANYNDKQNLQILQTVLTRTPGVVGVLTPQTSFLGDQKGTAVTGELLQRGLLYVGQPLRGLRQPPLAPVDDVVDVQPWRSAVEDRLSQAEAKAKSSPAQVLVLSPRPVSYTALIAWIDGLAAQGIQLAPVSAVAAPPGGK